MAYIGFCIIDYNTSTTKGIVNTLTTILWKTDGLNIYAHNLLLPPHNYDGQLLVFYPGLEIQSGEKKKKMCTNVCTYRRKLKSTLALLKHAT